MFVGEVFQMLTRVNLYSKFNFVLHAPNRNVWFGATAVFNDPFDGSLWVGAGHKENELSLMQILGEETSLHVWLCPARPPRSVEEQKPRLLRVDFNRGDYTWFPLDLDAAESGMALDKLCHFFRH